MNSSNVVAAVQKEAYRVLQTASRPLPFGSLRKEMRLTCQSNELNRALEYLSSVGRVRHVKGGYVIYAN